MKFSEIELGSAPSDEECAQVGDADYMSKSRVECAAFKAQILRHYPIPPGAQAGIRINLEPHDFGVYREVALTYGDQAGIDWAHMVENDPNGVLVRWDEKALEALGLKTI